MLYLACVSAFSARILAHRSIYSLHTLSVALRAHLMLSKGNNLKGAFMIKKEHWWITQLKEKENAEALKWFEKQDILAKIAEKERTITKAFQKEINKKREEINKLQKEIEDLIKECNQCLAKISVGDTGVQELHAERNSKK